jgi:hypothetical protein
VLLLFKADPVCLVHAAALHCVLCVALQSELDEDVREAFRRLADDEIPRLIAEINSTCAGAARSSDAAPTWKEPVEVLACGCIVLRRDGVSRMRVGSDSAVLGDQWGYGVGGWPVAGSTSTFKGGKGGRGRAGSGTGAGGAGGGGSSRRAPGLVGESRCCAGQDWIRPPPPPPPHTHTHSPPYAHAP